MFREGVFAAEAINPFILWEGIANNQQFYSKKLIKDFLLSIPPHGWKVCCHNLPDTSKGCQEESCGGRLGPRASEHIPMGCAMMVDQMHFQLLGNTSEQTLSLTAIPRGIHRISSDLRIKRRRALLVLGWGSAQENLRSVLSAYRIDLRTCFLFHSLDERLIAITRPI